MKTIKFLLFILIVVFSIINVYSDNWVCYDATVSGVTEGELRNKFYWQPGSPLQIIRTYSSSSSYTKTAHIREGVTQKTFSYCPENNYYLKTTSTCSNACNSFSGAHHTQNIQFNDGTVYCGLGGSPSCTSWSSSNSCSNQPIKEYVCGYSNNLWSTMSATTWDNPLCRELAIRQDEEPILDLSSFDRLSFRNYPLYAGEKSDMSFVAYVEACINRVPMMNLKTQLLYNNTVSSQATGLYAKHETLDYNNENLGMLEDFDVPPQTEFMKIYSLNGELNAYRPWAWRSRLVEGIEKTVEKYNLNVPGYPTDNNPQKIGDLYYSSDFLGGAVMHNTNLDCSQKTMQTQTYSVHVPGNIPELAGDDMCTINDLREYYETYGLTNELENTLRNLFPFSSNDDMKELSISKRDNELYEVYLSNIDFDVEDLGFNSSEDFIEEYSSFSKQKELFEYFLDNGIVKMEDIDSNAYSILQGYYFYGNSMKDCGSYDPQFENHELRTNMDIEKDGNKKVTIGIPVQVMWINDMIVNLDIKVEKEISCEESWNFANLGTLNSKTLAQCLYNWDECILKPVNDPNGKIYREVADCGMGPPSDLQDTTLKDAARGNKVLIQNVPVYRKCVEGNDWISSENNYACVDGETYRCKYNPSLDTIDFVKKAKPGDILKRDTGVGYVCMNNGDWVPISCNQ